jgi:hypothetical protein
MPFSEKLRQDWAPILFFGIVITIKTYYLIIYLNSNEDLWGLLWDIGHIEDYGRGAAFYLTGGLTSMLYYAIALAFDTLVFFSFIIRVKARERPKGFRENVFPLITVFVPMIGFTLLIIPQVRQFVPGYSATTLNLLREISPIFPFYMNMAGLLAGLLGSRREGAGYDRPLPMGAASALCGRDHPHSGYRHFVGKTSGLVFVCRRGGPAGGTCQDRGAEIPEYGTRVPGVPGFHRFPLAVLAQSAVKGTLVFNAFPDPSYERFPKRRQGLGPLPACCALLRNTTVTLNPSI